MNNLFLFSAIFVLSIFFTEAIRRYSLKINLLDPPNSRSSHSIATPHGGGLSIVVIFLVIIFFSDSIPNNIILVFFGSGFLVALVGYLDDQRHIAARWRLLAHFIAAAWVLFWLGGVPDFQFFGFQLNTGWFGIVAVAFILVWLLNLFNFMDGIDGIAASETIFVASAGAYFSWLAGLETITYISLILTASTAGFLISNWPPAKIFMGDVGSGFLGLMLGIIAYASILQGIPVWIWLILLALFLVDSGVTLVRRILTGEKPHEAHCSHAYQHAARKWGHKKVTISVITINIFFLFPFAYMTYLKPEMGVIYTLLTFIPLIIVALKLKAGINDDEPLI